MPPMTHPPLTEKAFSEQRKGPRKTQTEMGVGVGGRSSPGSPLLQNLGFLYLHSWTAFQEAGTTEGETEEKAKGKEETLGDIPWLSTHAHLLSLPELVGG